MLAMQQAFKQVGAVFFLVFPACESFHDFLTLEDALQLLQCRLGGFRVEATRNDHLLSRLRMIVPHACPSVSGRSCPGFCRLSRRDAAGTQAAAPASYRFVAIVPEDEGCRKR